MLLLRSLHVENFLSHKRTSVRFRTGVTALVGDNGAGKTSVVDAVIFALTGESPRGRIEDLINHASSSSRVALTFELMGDEYRVERSLSRAGSPRHSALLYRNGRVIASGVTEVNRQIEALIGLKSDLISKLIIVRQGELLALFNLLASRRVSEKASFINTLLELDMFEKAYSELSEYEVRVRFESYNNFDKGYKVSQSHVRALESDYAKLVERMNERRRQLEDLTSALKGLEAKILSKRQEVMAAKSKVEALERSLSRMRELATRYSMLQETLKAKMERAEELKRELAALKRIEEEVEELRTWEEAYDLISRAQGLSTRLKGLEAELRDIELKLKLHEEVKRKAHILSAYEEARRRLEALMRERDAVKERVWKYRSACEDLSKLLSEIEAELRRVGEHLSPDVASIERRLAEVSSRLSELDERAARLADRQARLSAKLDEVEDRIKKVSEAKGRCPLCGRELSGDHKERVLKALRSQRRALEEELTRTRDELSSVRAELESLKLKAEGLSKVLEKARRARELGEKLTELKGSEEELSRLEVELEEADNRLRDLEEDYSKVKGALAMLRGVDVEELASRYRRLKDELSRVRTELEDTLLRLSDKGFKVDLESVGKLHATALGKLRDLASLRRRRDELRSKKMELERVLKEVAELEAEVDRVMRAGYRPGAERELERELGEASSSYEALVRELAELESSEKLMKEKASELRAEIAAIENDLKRLERAREKLRVLYFIRQHVLHHDGVPRLWRRYVLRQLEREVARFMEYFDLAYTGVKIEDESLEVRLVDNSGYEVSLHQLSGGEQVAVTLAILLGIYTLFGRRRLGVLFLDEPTIHLDVERRRKLIEILRGFRGGEAIPQLVVITHDREVEDAADYVYEVVKDRWSSVKEVRAV